MIKSIIDIFRRQAREHKTIKAFYYNRNYELGSGKERYPLLWLEDPITGRNKDNTFSNSLSFAILFVPESEGMVQDLQNLAFSIGLNIIERIKQDPNVPISIRHDWTYATLRNYYDDGACGCRFSISFTQANMQNLCLIDEQFDADGSFDTDSHLNHFDVSPTCKCEVFEGKLPDFDLKTRK